MYFFTTSIYFLRQIIIRPLRARIVEVCRCYDDPMEMIMHSCSLAGALPPAGPQLAQCPLTPCTGAVNQMQLSYHTDYQTQSRYTHCLKAEQLNSDQMMQITAVFFLIFFCFPFLYKTTWECMRIWNFGGSVSILSI